MEREIIREEHKVIDNRRKEQWMQDAQFFTHPPLKYLPQYARGLRPLCLMGLGFLLLPAVSYSVST